MGLKLVWWFKVKLKATRLPGQPKYRKFPSFSKRVGYLWTKESDRRLTLMEAASLGWLAEWPCWPRNALVIRGAFPVLFLKWEEKGERYGCLSFGSSLALFR